MSLSPNPRITSGDRYSRYRLDGMAAVAAAVIEAFEA
jgi:hypothetical protein